MDESQFAERMAKIRARFVSKVLDMIRESNETLLNSTAHGSEAVDATAAAHRRFHDVCGIAATLGFEAICNAARSLDDLLVGPFRDRRGLSAEELDKVKAGLESFRIAVLSDMQSTGLDRELTS